MFRTKAIRKIIGEVVLWRIGLTVVAAIALSTIGYLFPYPNFHRLIQLGQGIPLLWSWGAFDGAHYITIAEQGYIADHTQAFFPLYPLLMKSLGFITKNVLISGLIISNVAFLFAVILLFKLWTLDVSTQRAKRAILVLLFFPTVYYFGSVYSESLFMVLIFASFYAARKGSWTISALLASAASATRPLGIFMFPALVLEWFSQRKENQKISKEFPFQLLLVPLGLLLYMWYLHTHFNDALKFIHAQPAFGASRSDKIILLYQVFWRYAKMLVTVEPISLLYYRITQELLSSLFFLCLSIWSLRKYRASYVLFSFCCFITPTLTGTFSSMPRYVLVMFPCFLFIADLLGKNKWRNFSWFAMSIFLLIINLSLFLTGRWVA